MLIICIFGYIIRETSDYNKILVKYLFRVPEYNSTISCVAAVCSEKNFNLPPAINRNNRGILLNMTSLNFNVVFWAKTEYLIPVEK